MNPETITWIFKRLDELGSSSKEIAKKLSSLNIKGKRNDPFADPIALYFKPDCAHGPVVAITQALIKGQFITLPKPVIEFVRDFEANKYPELVKK